MVSAKIRLAVVAALFFLIGALLPVSHASGRRYVAPAPAPAPVPATSSPRRQAPRPRPPPPPPSPPSRIQPVVVVQGTIYCKSCKLSGYNRYMDASPLPNATAELVCYGADRVLNLTSTRTDKNGYFLVMVYDLGMFQRSRCRVYLGSSPTPLCAAPFIPSNKWLGLTLEREKVASLPQGVKGVYRPKSTLMFGPGSSGSCPAAAVPMM
ncbi:non-classical arabinogalactan protein 30-like [Oryza brachyantha]|uniref:non-classical arabinogalactan protein 30-like n=1 Tax=Oryza brachyantha TaxID=4533 RepID=UPI001ADBC82D|nr:non-classical arabinogalactan protein 30-like [Oryza brachyantha]